MDILAYNRQAWDSQVEKGNRWTRPVGPEIIAAARRGDWQVVLTPTKPVPRDWFPPLVGLDVLCLASGGGQQAPIFAAAGARVTLLDNSPAQLAQDLMVAQREQLHITAVRGDMADLSAFPDQSFGLIFHPCSNCFAPRIRPVWRRFASCGPAGFCWPDSQSPVRFRRRGHRAGELIVRHATYSDHPSGRERQQYIDKGEPLCWHARDS